MCNWIKSTHALPPQINPIGRSAWVLAIYRYGEHQGAGFAYYDYTLGKWFDESRYTDNDIDPTGTLKPADITHWVNVVPPEN